MASSDSEYPSILNAETLRHLLRHLEATDIDEFTLEYGETHIYLRREPGRKFLPASPPGQPSPANTLSINAPLTGVFYSRPSPDQPPYAELGTVIEPGQVVALIETMKLFNEVTAELGGIVQAIPVRDGELVEAGQPIYLLRSVEEEPV